ncbi:MAG: isoprenylcysteine carboxylmethyltransferase family protein, partial [Methylococcales bacterium]|nr:isoprenylcysteine carboxylmethyltransferase family protein [Methylococcales bacterium]
FKSILTGYFFLFLTIALLYRSYRVYKKTGINALTQTQEDRTLKILAFILKIHLLLVVGLIVDYVFGFDFLTANRFKWIPSLFSAGIGSVLLIICLALIITAQTQMSSSWRLEIDRKNKAELITTGLFKYSRNPILLAWRLAYFAMFLIIPCPYSLMTFLVGDICFQLQVRKGEEYLKNIYSNEYFLYCSQVRRWL